MKICHVCGHNRKIVHEILLLGMKNTIFGPLKTL